MVTLGGAGGATVRRWGYWGERTASVYMWNGERWITGLGMRKRRVGHTSFLYQSGMQKMLMIFNQSERVNLHVLLHIPLLEQHRPHWKLQESFQIQNELHVRIQYLACAIPLTASSTEPLNKIIIANA